LLPDGAQDEHGRVGHFQYPKRGSIGCCSHKLNLKAAPSAIFQYPKRGSIGCC